MEFNNQSLSFLLKPITIWLKFGLSLMGQPLATITYYGKGRVWSNSHHLISNVNIPGAVADPGGGHRGPVPPPLASSSLYFPPY